MRLVLMAASLHWLIWNVDGVLQLPAGSTRDQLESGRSLTPT